ncbi:MAG: hypothetical protein MSH67_00295, partial [Mitsuokella jalaludinii]|nr:hypothetical protein [Mitsuokella jalaludinii]
SYLLKRLWQNWMKSSGKCSRRASRCLFSIDILYNNSRAFTMGETGEKNRNMTICGRHSTNLQNFMSFTITYLSFASS